MGVIFCDYYIDIMHFVFIFRCLIYKKIVKYSKGV